MTIPGAGKRTASGLAPNIGADPAEEQPGVTRIRIEEGTKVGRNRKLT